MTQLQIFLSGTPIPKKRARVVGKRAYDPQQAEKDTVKWLMQSKKQGLRQLNGPLIVEFEFSFVKPKSARRKFHTVKPDIDNLIKFYLDCANNVIWGDDASIISIMSNKVYGETAFTRMTVTETEEQPLASWLREFHDEIDILDRQSALDDIHDLCMKGFEAYRLYGDSWSETAFQILEQIHEACDEFI